MESCKDDSKKESGPQDREAVSQAILERPLQREKFDMVIDAQPVKLYWLENKDIKMAMTTMANEL